MPLLEGGVDAVDLRRTVSRTARASQVRTTALYLRPRTSMLEAGVVDEVDAGVVKVEAGANSGAAAAVAVDVDGVTPKPARTRILHLG